MTDLPAPPSTILRAYVTTFAALLILGPLTWVVVAAMTGGGR